MLNDLYQKLIQKIGLFREYLFRGFYVPDFLLAPGMHLVSKGRADILAQKINNRNKGKELPFFFFYGTRYMVTK